MITKSITSAFILFILTIIYFANTDTMPAVFTAVYHIPHGDKVAHFLLMGTLSFLVNLALHGRTIHLHPSRPMLLGTLAVTLIVLLEELSQIFLPSRTFSLADLTADFLGIFLFGRLAAWLNGHFA